MSFPPNSRCPVCSNFGNSVVLHDDEKAFEIRGKDGINTVLECLSCHAGLYIDPLVPWRVKLIDDGLWADMVAYRTQQIGEKEIPKNHGTIVKPPGLIRGLIDFSAENSFGAMILVVVISAFLLPGSRYLLGAGLLVFSMVMHFVVKRVVLFVCVLFKAIGCDELLPQTLIILSSTVLSCLSTLFILYY